MALMCCKGHKELIWKRGSEVACLLAFLTVVVKISYAASFPAPAPAPSTNRAFVTRNGSRLQAGGKPYFFTGFNNYYLPSYGPWEAGRVAEIDAVFSDAKKLGLKVLRTWAFSDGQGQWNAIQPQLGVLNETVLSQGLDYVVATAGARGMRVVLTLTNYLPAYGGAQQWVHWYGGGTIADFWQRQDIRDGFKSYVKSILTRNNSLTGLPYKSDPTILAWDLVNEPFSYGDESGEVLTAWIADLSGYIKSLDSNHLVMANTWGYFGASTPQLVSDNPTDMYTAKFLDTVLFPAARICNGEDSSAILSLPHIDLASMHIYPEYWSFCTQDCNPNLEGSGPYTLQANLSEQGFLQLCSIDCRITFLRRWIQLHLQECARIGKPLVIGEFGSQRPMDVRNAYYSAVYDELAKAKQAGHPVGGSLFWILEAAGHPDYDTYTIYTNATSFSHNPQKPVPLPPATPSCAAPGPDFYNEKAYERCASSRVPVAFDPAVDIINDGWQDTLTLISQQAQLLTEESQV